MKNWKITTEIEMKDQLLQQILNLRLSDLVLWTENPRDPIDENASNQDVINRAFQNNNNKWNLKRLAKEMGPYYDFSEIPIVVFQNKKPIVFDGNRRIILALISQGVVKAPKDLNISLPSFPDHIPCNVCKKKIALQSIFRKHANNGSWDILGRDFFLHKYMNKEKSDFLIFDEFTGGFIGDHPELDKRFVKEEVLSKKGMSELGFMIKENRLYSKNSQEEDIVILNDLLSHIQDGSISTRNNRGNIIGPLNDDVKNIILNNINKVARKVKNDKKKSINEVVNGRVSKRTRRTSPFGTAVLFGCPLSLKFGDVNDLYRDICSLYDFYCTKKNQLSAGFPAIIRMTMRLLCEKASKDFNIGIDKYIDKYFIEAKAGLSQDEKTSLANQSVTQNKLKQLLNTGAHNYSSSRSLDQTIAISLILGAMLTLSHGNTKQ